MKTSEQLRRKAEALVEKLNAAGNRKEFPVDDVQELIHELSVHQVELEMQGEELRTSTEDLRRSNQRYSEHFLASPIPALRLDRDGRIWELNLAAEEVLGIRLAANEHPARSIHHSGAWIPNRQAFRSLMRKSLQQGSVCREEIRFTGKQKQERVFEVRIKPLDEESISPSGSQVLVFLLDRTGEVTDREDQAERFRTLDLVLDSDITGYWDWDIPADRIYYSPSWCRMLGYGPHELEESPDTFRRLIHPEDQAGSERQLELHLKPRGTPTLYQESRFLHKQGHWVWIICSGRVVERDDAGLPLRMVGCHIDNSRSKKAEEELRDNAERFRVLFEESPVRCLIHDAESGDILEANQASLDSYGFERLEQFMEEGIWLEEEPYTFETACENLRNARNKGTQTFVWKSRNLRGDIFWEVVTLQRVELNGKDRILSSSVDITGRKEAEQELLRLSTAIEQSPETVVITDLQGSIEYVNPAFETITGYTREEALGQNLRILKSGQQEDSFYHSMWNTLSEGKTWQGRIVNKRKDGSLFTEEATISPVKDQAGRIINFVAIKRDITAELQREEMYLQSQKLESVGRLASGVAHDFNNLLTGIMGQAELCKLMIAKNHEVQTNLNDILNAAERSAVITRQLMAFARRDTVSPEVLDLNQEISEIFELLQRLIGENIQLRFEPGPDLPCILIDPGHIDQILTNLCVNAKDAIEDSGRLTLVTSREPPGPEETLPRISLQVEDTGHGMTEETLHHLFEPFFTTKPIGCGTGLGLATVYGIVTRNRGTIDVTSTPGEGSCFRLCFPGVPTPEAKEPSKTTALRAKSDARILVVDDEKFICESLTYGLEALGYQVVSAHSPLVALQVVAESDAPFDLLITDVIMPNMNGRELAARVTEKLPGLKTLYISGYTADILTHQGVLEEEIHFLAKPFSLKDIASVVRDMLQDPQRKRT